MSETVIADDVRIKGEIHSPGDLELKGSIEGEITCRSLVVAERARVNGSVTAERVVVRGEVEGTITGIRVTLASSARVDGELYCKTLSVDEEAEFQGMSQRVEDPLGRGEDASAAEPAKKDKAEAKSAAKDDTKSTDEDGGIKIRQVVPATNS